MAASALRAFLLRPAISHIPPRAAAARPWQHFSTTAASSSDDECLAAGPPPNDPTGIVLFRREKWDVKFGLATLFAGSSFVYFFNEAARNNPMAAEIKAKHHERLAEALLPSHSAEQLADPQPGAQQCWTLLDGGFGGARAVRRLPAADAHATGHHQAHRRD